MYLGQKVVRRKRVNYSVNEGITISKGEYHLPRLHLLTTDEGKCIVFQSKKGVFPNYIDEDSKFNYGKDYFWKEVDLSLYLLLKDAITQRKVDYKHLDNFTYLVAYCKGKGVCLFEEGIFSK